MIPQFVKKMTDEFLCKESGPFDVKFKGTEEKTWTFVYVDDFTKVLIDSD